MTRVLDSRLRRDLSILSVIDFNRVARFIEQIDIPTLRKMFPGVFRVSIIDRYPSLRSFVDLCIYIQGNIRKLLMTLSLYRLE